jgi:hypothetical protein
MILGSTDVARRPRPGTARARAGAGVLGRGAAHARAAVNEARLDAAPAWRAVHIRGAAVLGRARAAGVAVAVGRRNHHIALGAAPVLIRVPLVRLGGREAAQSDVGV